MAVHGRLTGTSNLSRRQFLQRSAASGAAAYGALSLARGVHAAGSDVIKVGLIGCGGRGSGAAANAMNAGKDVRLVAMADVFAERIEDSRAAAEEDVSRAGGRRRRPLLRRLRRLPEGDPERRGRGADRLHVALPPHLPEGRRRRRQARLLREAARHRRARREDGDGRLRGGQEEEPVRRLGPVLAVRPGRPRDDASESTTARSATSSPSRTTYVGGPYILRERKPEWNEMQYQFQNWYHFNWLSGNDTARRR